MPPKTSRRKPQPTVAKGPAKPSQKQIIKVQAHIRGYLAWKRMRLLLSFEDSLFAFCDDVEDAEHKLRTYPEEFPEWASVQEFGFSLNKLLEHYFFRKAPKTRLRLLLMRHLRRRMLGTELRDGIDTMIVEDIDGAALMRDELARRDWTPKNAICFDNVACRETATFMGWRELGILKA